jgi:hypothetical protein
MRRIGTSRREFSVRRLMPQGTIPQIAGFFALIGKVSGGSGLRGGGRSHSRTRLHCQIPC